MTKEENILLHAEKLFAERGFDGASTRDICNLANVNIAMIGYYFGSKEGLLEKIFSYRMQQGIDFSTAICERKDIDAWQKFEILISKYIERVNTLKDFYLIMQREQINFKNPAIIKFIKESKLKFMLTYNTIVLEGQEKGIFKNKPRVEFLHSTISGTLFTAINAMPIYKNYLNGDEHFEKEYFTNLEQHLKEILKHILGYEEINK
jgi:AcrR family transcriptional regulator